MPRTCDKCKKEVSKITKDINSSLWLCEGCWRESRDKKKEKNIAIGK